MDDLSETETDRFLTTDEVARMARTSTATVRKWCLAGKLESARPGKRFLVSARSLAAVLEPIARGEDEE